MSCLLAVDPGLRGSGASLWVNGFLFRAAYVLGSKDGDRADAWNEMACAIDAWAVTHEVHTLAIELPQVYREAKLKGDPNDLIQLAAVVGAISAHFCEAEQRIYLPREHRGQVPKNIAIERAKARLSPEELAAVRLPKAKSLAHNMWDSVAIGLVHLKRM